MFKLTMMAIAMLFSAMGWAQSALDACAHTANNFNCVQYIRNYDGDTFMVNIPKVHPLIGQKVEVRVVGVDTPEMNSDDACERQAAFKAQQETEKLLTRAKRIDLIQLKRDKYFRILAEVKVDGESLTEHLVKNGFGIPYDGGKKGKTDWCRR